MTVILGFNAFHADSALAWLWMEKLLGAVAEERLGERHKHSSAFPATRSGACWLMPISGSEMSLTSPWLVIQEPTMRPK